MLQKYLNFIRGVSVTALGKTGVVLVTSAVVTFIFIELLHILGIFTNAYAGLISYLLLPTLFIFGLILIPVGWTRYRRSTGKSTRELLTENFESGSVRADIMGSRVLWILAGLTVANILFLSFAAYRTMHFMDQSEFCGTACHEVMGPEWITYNQSPHARVACVDCHVGEGFKPLVNAKLNGAWQMISAGFDLYERPIPTPVHNLRPARETCKKCHWPDKFYGNRLKTIVHYDSDEAVTPRYTTLLLKIDSGQKGHETGIHWHIAEENEVRYVSVNDEREEIIWVEARQADGSYRRYTNRLLAGQQSDADEVRVMDCVDCHNRATHIYEDPSDALDQRIHDGLIDVSLPFIKREALRAIKTSYSDKEFARQEIERKIRHFYQRHHSDLMEEKATELENSIKAVQAVYHRNVHPTMEITWGSYPNHIGHQNNLGCYRCHNQYLVDDRGQNIFANCTVCHSILAKDSDQPFEFLQNGDADRRETLMRNYLRDDFLESYY